MQLTLLKAKLHRAEVTHAEVDYEGSCAIDGDLLDMSGIREYELMHIYNVTTGARFSTYAIRGEHGSNMISMNGAAAHLAKPGDIVILCCYAQYEEKDLINHKPRLIYLHEQNTVSHTSNAIPVQLGDD